MNKNKSVHNILRMDYINPYISIYDQTNLLINNVMNHFCKEYGHYFGKRPFVIEYNDDCLSLITYRILSNIREFTNLNFVLLGTCKATKQYIRKTDRVYKNSKQIIKNFVNPIYIQVNHILYNVFKYNRKMGNFIDSQKEKINLIENFTPVELEIAMTFYGYTFKSLKINSSQLEWVGLNKFLSKPFENVLPPHLAHLKEVQGPAEIQMVYITGDNEKDIDTLQQIEQTPAIVFYFYKGEMPLILKDINFTTFVDNKTNIPCHEYGNLCEDNKWQDFMWTDNTVNFVGPWPADKKSEVLNAT